MSNERLFYNLKELLRIKGYKVPDAYIWSVADYIENCPVSYTIFDWLRDTEANYPEDLKGEDE